MAKIRWAPWPQYDQEHRRAVSEVIDSSQLFAGPRVAAFESEYQSLLGSGIVYGVGNATQGLHLVLAAFNIGIGDEVIVTPYSWISTASCILMQNAVPIFIDIDYSTLAIDPNQLDEKINNRTKAIIVTHICGYQAEIQMIREVAARRNIKLIEDASHAHGATFEGKPIGTFGDASVFSLHQRKAISVGDGGLIWTSQRSIADKIYRLRSFGDKELSYNYRMTEFAGALGSVGLKRLKEQNEYRRQMTHKLQELLVDCPGIKVRVSRDHLGAVYYATILEITNENFAPLAEELLIRANSLGVPLRKTWSPLNQHPHFNPVNTPARGLPWMFQEYKGNHQMQYSALDLPVTYSLIPNRLLELYINPGTPYTSLCEFANLIFEIFKRSK